MKQLFNIQIKLLLFDNNFTNQYAVCVWMCFGSFENGADNGLWAYKLCPDIGIKVRVFANRP